LATPANAQFEGQAELTALIAKSQPYQAMMVEAQNIFIDSLEHMTAAFAKTEAPLGEAEAKAWSEPWETKARARLAALKQQMATTPRITVDEAKAVFGDADTTGISELMASFPKHIEETIAAAEQTLNQTAALAPLVAAGDAAATDKLSKEMFAVSLYMVEIENQLLRAAIAGSPPGHPQRSLAQAILGGNLAMMEIQRVNLRNYNGEPLATEAAAARARDHITEAATAARRIPGEAKATLAAVIQILPPEGEAYGDKIRKAFATFDQSADVELEGLRLLEEAVSAMAREDFEKVFASAAQGEALADRRVALQVERTTYLSQ
jgi:hypothetical protein